MSPTTNDDRTRKSHQSVSKQAKKKIKLCSFSLCHRSCAGKKREMFSLCAQTTGTCHCLAQTFFFSFKAQRKTFLSPHTGFFGGGGASDKNMKRQKAVIFGLNQNMYYTSKPSLTESYLFSTRYNIDVENTDHKMQISGAPGAVAFFVSVLKWVSVNRK